MMSQTQIEEFEKRIHEKTEPGWYGLAIGRGWYEIVDECDKEITKLFPDYKVQQIKEKFGLLRYYCTVDFEESVTEIIGKAEAASAVTCEVCGEPGVMCNPLGSWVLTLCEEHYESQRKK
jgi:hypothetical protein